MPSRRSEKKSEPATSTARRVLPMELRGGDRLVDETGEWEIIARPYTTAGGKNARVRVQKVGQPPNVTESPDVGRARARQREASGCGRRGPQPMIRCVLGVALVVLTVTLAGCSRENAGERLTRECGEVVDARADSENTTNPDVATVKRSDMEAVIRSEQWATTPLRKAMQAEFRELETSRGYSADKYDAAWERMVNQGGERDALWRAAFDSDLPRRERIRNRMIRECVGERGTKEGAR